MLHVQNKIKSRNSSVRLMEKKYSMREVFCCGSLLLLVPAVRIYSLVQILC